MAGGQVIVRFLACAGSDPTLPAATGDTGPVPSTSPADPVDPVDPTDPTDPDTTPPVEVEPPLEGTSGGSGGADAPGGADRSAGGADYRLIAPSGSSSGSAVPLLVVFSGVEGADLMTQNFLAVAPFYGLGGALVAVLDGRFSDAADGALVLDDVRAGYDVDNDRTWLLSESAGTAAGLELGLSLRQSWFAAYWANDVNARRDPDADAGELGFAPWGNAGPGGDLPDATAIVDGMASAGYRLPADAPYSGPGSTVHGSTEQFLEAVGFFADKER